MFSFLFNVVVHVTDGTLHISEDFWHGSLKEFTGTADSKGKPVHAQSANGGPKSREETWLFG